MLILLVIADIIWVSVMSGVWSHDGESSQYWKDLSKIHSFGIIMAYLECLLKLLIVAYLAYDYKQKYPSEMSNFLFDYI